MHAFKSVLFVIFLVMKNNAIEVVVRVYGGDRVALLVAAENGYEFQGKVKGFRDTYLFWMNSTEHHSKLDKRGSASHHVSDPRVTWAEEQIEKERQKRDFLDISDVPHERVKRIEYVDPTTGPPAYFKILKKPESEIFNDELWENEWYLKNSRSNSELPHLDLNVLKVYQAGITGKNIRISVLDDGLEYTHEDLIDNYDPNLSYDCNEDDSDPMPRYDLERTNNHGTRCAGEIAMTANNWKCGVGIAFNAKIGGIKVLDGLVTDRLEGIALSYGLDLIDIYSASWGPLDDGQTVDGPGKLAREALERGTRLGRQSKGSIFVWASGNGGGKGDNCNCDGYVNSIYTISVGSASERGIFPWYGEACASLLAVTYSSGARKEKKIATTDLNNNCTIKHTGTSASAPLAAGIIALALEANPNLTWRDIQHLIVWSSESYPLVRNPGWKMNGVGLWFNTRFGFGLINAYRLIIMAASWKTVPEKTICKTKIIRKSIPLQASRPLSLPISTSSCKWTPDEVNYLEHVEVRTSIEYSRRGSLEIYLTSPSGTMVELLERRIQDDSEDGFENWSFMSVMTWGEQPQGVWYLTITDKDGPEENYGLIGPSDLVLHGTRMRPEHMNKDQGENM